MKYGELYGTWGYIGEAAHSSPATSRGTLAIPSGSQPNGKLKDHYVGTQICSGDTSVEACLLGSPVVRTYTYVLESEHRRAGVVRCR